MTPKTSLFGTFSEISGKPDLFSDIPGTSHFSAYDPPNTISKKFNKENKINKD